ncbi:MAG TPA: tetratricopeptide repeat protein [Gammaproteobacteria bacterium]|nr:tetratricopeptide repeat protein [Gammaproteobacteria bacterium]
MSRTLSILVSLAATVCVVTVAHAQEGVMEAGTAQREERAVTMSEGVYRRLNAIHEYLGSGEYAEALSRLDELSGGRLSSYEEALVHQSYGFVYAQQGDYARAIEAFERCLALDALPNIANQGMLYSMAGLYQNVDQFQKAIDTMGVWFSYAEEPVPADAYMLVGSSYAQLEQLDRALPYVQEANGRASAPNESWHMLELSIYSERMEYESAAELLRRMVVLWPDTARYWEMLSYMYLELEDDSNALATLMVAYKKGMVEGEAKLLNLVRLNLFLELPYEAGAILEAELAKGTIGESRENLELLLSAWTAAREYAKAVEVIDVLAPRSEDGRYYMQKAQLLGEQADWAGVVEATTLALEKGNLDEPGQALVLKGMAEAELGEFEQALRTFDEARDHEDSARRNADAWIEYVRDRRQVARNGD